MTVLINTLSHIGVTDIAKIRTALRTTKPVLFNPK